MKRGYNYIMASIMTLFLFVACDDNEAIPEINLLQKPKDMSAYLSISFLDSTYFLKDSVDNYYSSLSYITTANEEVPYPSWSGARFYNDSSIIDFSVYYINQWMGREDLLKSITKNSQDLSFNAFDGDKIYFLNYGFMFQINIYTTPMGGSRVISSDRTVQPETSFFNITDYYAGQSPRTVWLKGAFKVNLDYNNSLETLKGDFFMEFPLWYEEE